MPTSGVDGWGYEYRNDTRTDEERGRDRMKSNRSFRKWKHKQESAKKAKLLLLSGADGVK